MTGVQTCALPISTQYSLVKIQFLITVLGGKPRSLRDLILGGNTPNIDDGSSSEEE